MKILPLLLALLQVPALSQELLTSVPEDTLAVFVIHDLPALTAKREESPLRHLPRLDSVKVSNPEHQATLTLLNDFQKQIDGEFLIRINNPGGAIEELLANQQSRGDLWTQVDLSEEEGPGLDAIIAKEEEMRTRNQEILRAMLLVQARVRDPEAVEVILTELRAALPGLHWGLQDHFVTVSFSETGVADAKARLNNSEAAPLASTPDFLQAMEVLGPRDTLLYMNLPHFVNAFTRVLHSIQGDTPAVDLSRFTAWLEPQTLLPMAFGTFLDLSEQDLRIRSHYGFRNETGLSRLLLTDTDKPAPMPAFVHKDADQVMTLHWNPAQTLQNLQQDLSRIAPEMGIAFGFFKMSFNVNIGLDIETQFLQTLGTGLTLVSETDQAVVDQLAQLQDLEDPAALLALSQQHPTGGIHYLIGFELEDRETFQSSLETLVTNLTREPLPAPIQDGDIEKTFLFSHLTTFPAELRTQIAGAFIGNHWLLAIGDTGLLNRAHTAHTRETERLWTQPEFIQSLETTGARISASAERPATADRQTPPARVLSYTGGRELQNTLRQLQTGARWLSILSGGAVTFTETLPEHPLFINSIGTSVRQDQRLINETRLRFAPPPAD
ncbi:MAG: hypothetical protein JJU05_09730 [Verrucomicrobia bacterium]|nr:hypothetical protein [Verrucomicrobiota bacterium]MCH8527572.1 hypothetical protein [Kiritimatiellia bacterium]